MEGPKFDTRLIQQLGNAGASVVALDIVFSEPDRTSPPQIADRLNRMNGDPQIEAALRRLPDNDAELAKTMREVPVVTGFFLSNDPQQAAAMPKAGFAVSGDSPLSADSSRSGACTSNGILSRLNSSRR